MTIAAIAEPALMLAIFTVAITVGSTDFSHIVATAQQSGWDLLNPTHLMAFAALFIVLLAETGRIPIDNPATHLELTMIHEAMLLEYSGRYLALMEWGASIKQLVLMAILVNIFLPVGLAADGSALALGLGLAVFLGKIFAVVRRGGAGRNRQRQAAPVPRAGPVERGLRARGHGPVVHVPLSLIMNPAVSNPLPPKSARRSSCCWRR